MNTSEFRRRVETACKRYGPGRLPGADRPALGAGYAGAAAALGTAVLFGLAVLGAATLGSPLGLGGPVLAVVAVAAVPFVVPAAFVSGAVVWRVVPSELPFHGVVAGIAGTAGTYLGALALFVAASTAWALLGGRPLAEVVTAAYVVGFVAVALTGWLALPLGSVCGAVYARVGRRGTDRDRTHAGGS